MVRRASRTWACGTRPVIADRSTASISLIAAATFVIVAVAAGRRNPAVETPELNSGNGGFRLVAQSTEPILPDLNTPSGRANLQVTAPPKSADESLLTVPKFFAFRLRPGEDASCLNVYQTRLPTILGVPKSLIDRGGFRFIVQRDKSVDAFGTSVGRRHRPRFR